MVHTDSSPGILVNVVLEDGDFYGLEVTPPHLLSGHSDLNNT